MVFSVYSVLEPLNFIRSVRCENAHDLLRFSLRSLLLLCVLCVNSFALPLQHHTIPRFSSFKG